MWGGGFFWYLYQIPFQPVSPQQNTDAIVVLTGGGKRISSAFHLLEQNLAPKVFISGLSLKNRKKDIRGGFEDSDQHKNVYVGYAKNTHQNAYETKTWVEQHKIRTLRLVTAHYHMPRSLYEFSKALPKVHIIPHPVIPDIFREASFTNYVLRLKCLAKEYHKLLFYVLIFHRIRLD